MTNLDRPKFDKGDRVRAKAGLVTGYGPSIFVDGGTIITIEHPMYGSVIFTAPNGMMAPFPEDGFELYAKAGEFVVGDRVVWTHPESGHTFKPGDMLTIAEPKYDAGTDTLWGGDGPWWFHKSQVRLATPEEIAAAEAKTVELTGCTSAEQAARFSVKIDAVASTFDGMADHIAVISEKRAMWEAHNPPPSAEIPAAEFDFSTIKAGDEVIVRLKIGNDGVDYDGELMSLGNHFREGALTRFIHPSEVISVIPASKPKTLRERAIEAAAAGERGKIVDADQMYRIVDAVLAEVEKGR